jgi:acyl transferase domain-containing protein
MNMFDKEDGTEIAIIGMAGRFPMAGSVGEFWGLLRDGVEAITFFTDEELEASGCDSSLLKDPNYVKAAALLSNRDQFDAFFFSVSAKEAEIMDPQHRLLLECAWTALEDAGYSPDNYKGPVGVFAGATINTYLLLNIASNPAVVKTLDDLQINIGNGADFLTTRISYKLNLKGPSHLVQSACSTSLVAVHVACQSLLNDECDMALAGGVSINEKMRMGYRYVEGGMSSPDGHCRAFDAKAQGTIFGSGVGIVVLKRLEAAIADGDTIHAIIKGSAVNNDGSMKVGYTAPSVQGQAQVITEALANAGVSPDTITYIETHGTGTPLGDPIEIQALKRAFGIRGKKGFCAIGSVKTNVGHLDAAAGVTGLIKTVLALKHGMIPPSLHFEQPNPQIDFHNSPFYVNTRLSQWNPADSPRRAGVSAFGVGGTNAHIILEEPPALETSSEPAPVQLLALSAKTVTALETATANLVTYLKQHGDVNLGDVAYTLQVGRKAFGFRRILACHDVNDAIRALESSDHERIFGGYAAADDRGVIFMFPGQGSQQVNMGLGLYRDEKKFRDQIDLCSEILRPHFGLDLREVLYPDDSASDDAAGRLRETHITQPALFALEYALAQLLMSWGLRPAAMIGHSVGEYVASVLAGVMTLEEALKLSVARGSLMRGLPAGAMLSVPLPESELLPILEGGLSLAAVNAPSSCVVSGNTEQIDRLEDHLNEMELICRRLQTTRAFHSEMMEPIVQVFGEQVRKIRLRPPQIPYISNVTGTWIKNDEAVNPDYWAKHLRQTVRFSDGLSELMREPKRILLEVGPGQTLSRLARRQPARKAEQLALATMNQRESGKSDLEYLLTTLGKLWVAGADIQWPNFYQGQRRRRIPLPTYPFERKRYWIEPEQKKVRTFGQASDNDYEVNPELAEPAEHAGERAAISSLHPRPQLQTVYVAPTRVLEKSIAEVWQNALGLEQVGIYDNFFELGGDSLLALQVISRLKNELKMDIPVASLYEGVTIYSLVEILAKDQQKSASPDAPGKEGQREERMLRRRQYQSKQRSRKGVGTK